MDQEIEVHGRPRNAQDPQCKAANSGISDLEPIELRQESPQNMFKIHDLL